MSIPKVINFVWIGTSLPKWAEDNMRQFERLNPEFKVVLHDAEVLLPEFRNAYDSIRGDHVYARKSDLLRVSVLLGSGGWYFDSDIIPIRPLSELYANYNGFPKQCFITHGSYLRGQRWIANGVIGTSAGSPFLLKVYDGILARAAAGVNKWAIYGPELYTEIVKHHPELTHVGLLDDFYRIQDRKRSMAAFASIRKDGYSSEAIIREVGEPLPFAIHASMQDEVNL